jgi:hypothetical protein
MAGEIKAILGKLDSIDAKQESANGDLAYLRGRFDEVCKHIDQQDKAIDDLRNRSYLWNGINTIFAIVAGAFAAVMAFFRGN